MDKDIIKTILTAPSGKGTPRFEKRLDGWRIILGDGLLSLDGDVWWRHRRTLEPSFNSNLVKESLNDYVPKRMQKMVKAWKVAAKTGREIDAYSHLSALALDAVGDVGFHHDFKGVDLIEKWAQNDDGGTKLPALQDTFIISMLNALELSTGMVFAMLMDPSADVLFFLSKFYPHVGLNRRTFGGKYSRVNVGFSMPAATGQRQKVSGIGTKQQKHGRGNTTRLICQSTPLLV